MSYHENLKWKSEHLTPMWNHQNHAADSWFTCTCFTLLWAVDTLHKPGCFSLYICSSTPHSASGHWWLRQGCEDKELAAALSFPFLPCHLVNKDVTSVGKDVMGFLGYSRFFECHCLLSAQSKFWCTVSSPASEWPTYQSGTPHPSLCWCESAYSVPTCVSLGVLCSRGVQKAALEQGDRMEHTCCLCAGSPVPDFPTTSQNGPVEIKWVTISRFWQQTFDSNVGFSEHETLYDCKGHMLMKVALPNVYNSCSITVLNEWVRVVTWCKRQVIWFGLKMRDLSALSPWRCNINVRGAPLPGTACLWRHFFSCSRVRKEWRGGGETLVSGLLCQLITAPCKYRMWQLVA